MTENERREECIEDLNQQIDWIEGIKAHQFPGWGHAVNAMRQAIALLKAQEPVSIEERLVLDKLHTIQEYARVNEIHWMADGAAFAENVMNMLRGEINQFRKAQEPRVMTLEEVKELHPDDDVYIERISSITGVHYIYATTVWRVVSKSIKFCPDNATLWLSEYGETWRCWTSKPTEAQREAEPWPEV